MPELLFWGAHEVHFAFLHLTRTDAPTGALGSSIHEALPHMPRHGPSGLYIVDAACGSCVLIHNLEGNINHAKWKPHPCQRVRL